MVYNEFLYIILLFLSKKWVSSELLQDALSQSVNYNKKYFLQKNWFDSMKEKDKNRSGLMDISPTEEIVEYCDNFSEK